MKTAISPAAILGGSASASRRAATRFLSRLVSVGVILLLAGLCLPAQTPKGEWVWMGGSSALNQTGVYGTLGVPAPGNTPGARAGGSTWTDGSGHLWLFGGNGNDAAGNSGPLNDLWEFNFTTSEWTWMGGSSTGNQLGVYGTLRTPAAGNIPGSRWHGASWTDGSGHFWLFGGTGNDAGGGNGYLNDLWEFNPSTNQWTWMGGGSTVNQVGLYGTLGTPGARNTPGGREPAASWTDSDGHLWLYGGFGYDANGNVGWLDDLWDFNPSTNQWTYTNGRRALACYVGSWGAGTECVSPEVYGTLGIAAAGNIPGGRSSASAWTDASDNLWLFGGYGTVTGGCLSYDLPCQQYFGELWEFNPSTNEWAWMGGSEGPGQYGALGTPAPGNNPTPRDSASSWTDSDGHLWLFGGSGYLTDLWEYDPFNNEWAWMGGCSEANHEGVYGTLGTPDAGNMPGSRADASSWTGSDGNFWLFGGSGVDADGHSGSLGDLWEFLPAATSPPGAAPTLSLSSGTYTSPQTVSISDTTPDAVIYYTLDGSSPTICSAAYTVPLTFGLTSQTVTLNAIAVAPGYANSLASATYTINLPSAAMPVFTPPEGTYTSILSVQLSSSTPGAAIYYTLDGSTPTTGSAQYTAALTIGQTTTVKAIAVAYGYTTSAASATYTINLPVVAKPVFAPPGGIYASVQSVQLSTATPGAAIYYTLDGTEPTTGSARYTAALTIDGYTTVKAIAVAYDYTNSRVAMATYAINLNLIGEWEWMSGSNSYSQAGVYGTLGTPAPGNTPGAREASSSWSDGSGNLWLFGGYALQGYYLWDGFTNDLWEFDPSTNDWTWVSGSSGVNQPGVYGTLGTPATGNTPGSRSGASSSTDTSGHLWLFGGNGHDSVGTQGNLNDRWEFNPSTNEWAWMGGSSTANQPGVYGTLGTPATGNTPGSRSGASSSTDTSGHLWLFGGGGLDSAGTHGYLNDLWMFNPSTNEWAWMRGSSTANQPGVYGTFGTPAPANTPGARSNAVTWTDGSGHLWLFGGSGLDAVGKSGFLSDLWDFNPLSNEWTWMAGSSTVGEEVVYGAMGTPAPANTPGGRNPAGSWKDANGNFWLFGGESYDDPLEVSLNDLWEFSPSTNEWAWMGGCSGIYHAGVYDKLRTQAAGNIPGARRNDTSWTDSDGSFWLFGGESTPAGLYNDLWKFPPLSATSAPAATPAFSVSAGTYTSPQTVIISDATPGAVIYYTLDGSSPTVCSAEYATALTIGLTSQTVTVNATAFAAGYKNSALASATYTINLPAAAKPVFTPAAGTYTSVQSVQISDTTPGAKIYYTLDGSTPTTGSAKYAAALTIAQNTTVNAIAVAYGYNNSAMASATYILPTAAAPVFTPAAGTYSSIQSVQISSTTPGASIYYTLDGSTPTIGSARYSAAVTISNVTTVINAIAVAYGYNNSAVVAAGYTISSPPAPTFSLPSGAYLTPQSLTISDTDTAPGVTIYYTTDGSWPSASSTPYTGAIAINKNVIIRAIAALTPDNFGPTTSGEYGIEAPAPTLSLAGGEYFTAQSLTISDVTPGATIYYTTDGSAPSRSATPYTGPIAIDKNMTVRATIAAPGYDASPHVTAEYGIKTPAPTFSLAGGEYYTPQSLTISAAAGATIYYTTDGSGPSASATLYAGAIAINKNVTIRAIAVMAGYANSPFTSRAYGIMAPAPVISPGTGIYGAPQQVTISDSMSGAAIYYTTDGSRPTSGSTPYTGSITVSAKQQIRAVATAAGYANSPLVYADYGIR